jgi:hypothetical protein
MPVTSDRLKHWLTRRGWLEPGGFLLRPQGALVPALACAALLLALGYEAAQHNLGSQLDSTRLDLAEQITRANRLAQENQLLESRLAQALARLETRSGLGQTPEDGSQEGPSASVRVLHNGETITLLDGKLSLTLQSILSSPRRALLRLKTPGSQDTEPALRPGQDLTLKLGRQPWRLVLLKIHASSVSFSLRQMGE